MERHSAAWRYAYRNEYGYQLRERHYSGIHGNDQQGPGGGFQISGYADFAALTDWCSADSTRDAVRAVNAMCAGRGSRTTRADRVSISGISSSATAGQLGCSRAST